MRPFNGPGGMPVGNPARPIFLADYCRKRFGCKGLRKASPIFLLRQSLQSRKIVERAKGALMKRYRWSEADAFYRLRCSSMNRRIPMVDLAQAILNGKEIDLGSPRT